MLEDEASIYINLSKLTGEKFQINADMTGDDVDHNGLVGQHLLTQYRRTDHSELMLTLCRGTDHSELIDKNMPASHSHRHIGNFSHADITVGQQLLMSCIFDQVVMSLKMVMISLI